MDITITQNNKMITYLIIFSVFSFVTGTIMGSAMTCLGDRLAENKSWIKGRSQCDSCGHELAAADLIPVFSYLLHRGKCPYCDTRISSRYFWTELFTGTLFTLAFLQQKTINLQLIQLWGMISLLLALSITDLDVYMIPDQLIIALLIWRLIIWIIDGRSIYLLISSLISAFLLSGSVLLIVWIMDKLLQKETMGYGDIKLLFITGLYTGITGGLITLILACFIGILTMLIKKSRMIPFGPSISTAAVIVSLYGSSIIQFLAKIYFA